MGGNILHVMCLCIFATKAVLGGLGTELHVALLYEYNTLFMTALPSFPHVCLFDCLLVCLFACLYVHSNLPSLMVPVIRPLDSATPTPLC